MHHCIFSNVLGQFSDFISDRLIISSTWLVGFRLKFFLQVYQVQTRAIISISIWVSLIFVALSMLHFLLQSFFENLLQFYFSEHAKEKLRNSVHYTSSKCSQQVENELRETFTRLELGRFSNLTLWLAIQSGRRNWVSFILKSNLSCQWSHYRYWR